MGIGCHRHRISTNNWVALSHAHARLYAGAVAGGEEERVEALPGLVEEQGEAVVADLDGLMTPELPLIVVTVSSRVRSGNGVPNLKTAWAASYRQCVTR